MPAILPAKTQDNIRNFVREVLTDRGLAVTGLNNYLKCPWQYFYRTLLRIPEPQKVPLMFGNAIHRTLRAFFDVWAGKEEMSKPAFVDRLYYELGKESFTDKELKEAKKIGEEALHGYYTNYYPNWSREIKNEFPVDVTLSIGDFELRLTGKLDKIEFLDDGRVSVVDYKTGKTHSRNYIEGKTKEEGAGDYKRQLIFYKLLLDNFADGKYNMQTGVIDFIMPDEKDRFHREEFQITIDEVLELKGEVERVAGEILALSFWDKRCGNKECGYCKLREMVILK